MTKRIGEPPSAPINGEDHMSIRVLLPEYVSIQVLGQELPLSWLPLEQHLARCPACRDEAEALLQLIRASYCEACEPLPQVPAPDLSFLQPARVAPAANLPGSLRAQFRQIVIQFTPDLLPTMRIAMAARSRAERLQYAYRLPPETPSDPDITVEVLTRDEQAEHGLVRITVELPDSDPFDQAGSTVELAAANLHLSAVTDQNGVVRFNDVPLDQLGHWRITVTPRPGHT